MSTNRRLTAAPIRNGTSLPQDTSRPSLLTTLPPEIRNLIYEHAFLRDGPTLIIDSQEYTKSSFRQYDEDDESILNQPLTAHNCNLPVSLLRSCRQMYAETSGILYGANDFMLSVCEHRHNRDFRQLRTTVRWPTDIGLQYYLLNRVAIDMSSWCLSVCVRAASRLHIAPLMKVTWARKGAKLDSVFAYTDKMLDAELHDNLSSPDALESIAPRLNTIWASLVGADIFDLEKYAACPTLLDSIWLTIDVRVGAVHFAYLGRDVWKAAELYRRFDIDAGGNVSDLRTFETSAPTMVLGGLPVDLFKDCLRYAINSDTAAVFDLDSSTAHVPSHGLLGLKSFWRARGL